MYEKLKDIFYQVNDALKFAETKHTSLIVLNGASIFGLLSAYGNISSFPYIKLITFLMIVFLLISLFISFWALLPKNLQGELQVKLSYTLSKVKNNPNLF